MTQYKVFHINDILEKIDAITVPYPTSVLPDSVQPGYSRPGLTAGIENQGLSKYVPDECNVTELKNVISISANGANSGATFYQDHLFTIIQDAYAVKIRDDVLKEPVRELYLYLTAVLNHRLSSYGWENKAGWNKIKDLQIQLPVTDSGQLDVQYMEQYIKRIEAQYIKRIEAYLSVLGYDSIDDCELSSQDLKVLSGPDEWGEFRIGELFDKQTVRGISGSLSQYKDSNGYPVYGQNIKYQYDYKILAPERYLFKVDHPILAYASSTGMIGMINENFYRTGDNGAFQALIPKHNLSVKQILYFLTSVKMVFAGFNYNTGVNDVLDLDIMLPVHADGSIAYDFMDQYITAIEKKKVLLLKQHLDKRLDLYRGAIK